MNKFTRRTVLCGGSLAAASALTGLSLPALAQQGEVRWAELKPGFTVLLTGFIKHHRLDQKHGFSLSPAMEYTSVPTYYSDFDVGNYDICIGSWDTFATRYVRGVPLTYICNVTTANMINFISLKESGLDDVSKLLGKVVAAPQSTGTYQMAKAVLSEFEKIDLENSSTIQNVNNPAASVSVLRAGSAEAGLTWEPNVTNGMVEDDRIQSIFSIGDAYTKGTNGKTLPYFGVAVRKELITANPEIGLKVDAMFRDCIEGILSDIPSAVTVVGEATGFRPEVLAEAIKSGRLDFKYVSMTDAAARDNLKAAAEFCVRNGALAGVPDDNFFFQG